MGSKVQARDVNSVELEAEALRLRRRKKTYAAIAAQLGISIGWAHDLVQRAYKRAADANRDEAEAERREDLARIEIAIEAIWPKVEQGDGWSIDRLVSLLTLKARLWGYDNLKAAADDKFAVIFAGIRVELIGKLVPEFAAGGAAALAGPTDAAGVAGAEVRMALLGTGGATGA